MRFFVVLPVISLLVTVASIPLPNYRSTTTDLDVRSILHRRTDPISPKVPSPGGGNAESRPPSPTHLDPAAADKNKVVVGVCVMDEKARGKAMSEILSRMQTTHGGFEVKIFGDEVILKEDVAKWPTCDVLISFFSTGFPLEKAISYVKLRNPYCINELPQQALLQDRRHVGAILKHLDIPTPESDDVSRDGGPKIDENLKKQMEQKLGITLGTHCPPKDLTLSKDSKSIIFGGHVMHKPIVEKPVSGEDHNVIIYFEGGGGRRLFRKVGDKSSELDATLNHPRTEGSYIYELFIKAKDSVDIKVYVVGEHIHAETRKSPVVDGKVERNAQGKEVRHVIELTEREKGWARAICSAFGQGVCGFDMLRCGEGTDSHVIDVNGWSFVKGNNQYYDNAAYQLAQLCLNKGSSSASVSSSSTSGNQSPTQSTKRPLDTEADNSGPSRHRQLGQ